MLLPQMKTTNVGAILESPKLTHARMPSQAQELGHRCVRSRDGHRASGLLRVELLSLLASCQDDAPVRRVCSIVATA